MFLLSLSALVIGLFNQVIGLTCKRGLIREDTGGLEYKTIDWNIHTILDLDNVSDLDVFLMECLFFAISKDGNNFADLCNGLLLEELSLFLVV